MQLVQTNEKALENNLINFILLYQCASFYITVYSLMENYADTTLIASFKIKAI